MPGARRLRPFDPRRRRPPESAHLERQPKAESRAPAPDPTAALAAAVEAVDLVVPEGHGRITGHVRTKEGAPVAGVLVRGWTPYPDLNQRRSTGSQARVSVVEQVRLAALSAKWGAATEREGLSDANGEYTLTEVVTGEYYLRAWATGYDVRSIGRGRAVDGATIDFLAVPVVTVPISVLAPDGTAAATARVDWSLPKGGGGGSAEWWSDTPDVAIGSGTWSLVASVGDDLRSKPVVVTIGTTPGPVVLRLEVRNRIEGTVRFDAADKDWTYAFVTARRHGASEKEASERQGARPPDWSFRFEDLEPGDYDVSAALNDHAPLATELVRVVGGKAKVTLTVPRLASAQVLEARVYGPDGTALSEEDVNFSIMQRSGTRGQGSGGRSVRRPDGSFLIALTSFRAARVGEGGRGDGASASDAERWRWSIVVTSKAHGTKEVEFTFGVTPRIEVRFE